MRCQCNFECLRGRKFHSDPVQLPFHPHSDNCIETIKEAADVVHTWDRRKIIGPNWQSVVVSLYAALFLQMDEKHLDPPTRDPECSNIVDANSNVAPRFEKPFNENARKSSTYLCNGLAVGFLSSSFGIKGANFTVLLLIECWQLVSA